MSKNSKRKSLSSFTIAFAVVLLLACCLGATNASSAIDAQEKDTLTTNQITDVVLPDFIEGLLNSYSTKVSPSKLDRMRNQWAEQIKRKQDRIAATNGSVLDFSLLDSQGGANLAAIEFTWTTPGGVVDDANYMIGDVDQQYAHLHAEWIYNTPPEGAEAFAVGYMSAYAGGDFYINCKRGQHSTSEFKDFVYVCGSNDPYTPFEDWQPIGSANITFFTPARVYIGPSPAYFACIGVCTYAGFPDNHTCVKVDAVYASESSSCLLSISAGEGGTTNPSLGDHWYDPGTPVQVTANPYDNYEFDHWTLDGESYTQNPITVTMTQSQRYLQAHFTCVVPTHQLTMLAINQYGVPGYVPLYIDGQYVGTTGYTYTVTEGDHQIGVPGVLLNGHYSVFVAYYYDGEPDYDNPMTLSVTEDKTVYACYWTYW